MRRSEWNNVPTAWWPEDFLHGGIYGDYPHLVGEATEVPRRSPGRGPPSWKSRVLRLKVPGDEDEAGGRGRGAGEEVA